MTDVRLELPFPPKQLSPNARVGWQAKARAVRGYRTTCGWAAVDARQAQGLGSYTLVLAPPVRAVVTFVVPTRHKRDEDNLLAMLKPAWDGLVDAGVLAGDDSERFSVESCEIVHKWERRAPAPEPCVIVKLRSL